MLQLPMSSNFTPCHSTASHVRVTGHFETGELNDPQMTLNTKMSKVPHIYVATTPESQVLLHFALHPTVF